MAGSGHRRTALAQLERDRALTRLSAARKWLIAAAATLTAGVSALVSEVAPGHTVSKRARVPRAAPRRTASLPRMPPPASAAELGLQAPAEAPQAAAPPQPPAPQVAPAPSDQAAPPAPPSGASADGGGPVVSGGS
jgi:hypothetical protein